MYESISPAPLKFSTPTVIAWKIFRSQSSSDEGSELTPLFQTKLGKRRASGTTGEKSTQSQGEEDENSLVVKGGSWYLIIVGLNPAEETLLLFGISFLGNMMSD